jgi:hypothetical protein
MRAVEGLELRGVVVLVDTSSSVTIVVICFLIYPGHNFLQTTSVQIPVSRMTYARTAHQNMRSLAYCVPVYILII